jgi:hypothetical protein
LFGVSGDQATAVYCRLLPPKSAKERSISSWGRGGVWHGAGRPKGSKNKRKPEIREGLDELECDPITGLARIRLQAESESDGVKVEDTATGLLWERKRGTFDASLPASGICEAAPGGCPDRHDVNNGYA